MSSLSSKNPANVVLWIVITIGASCLLLCVYAMSQMGGAEDTASKAAHVPSGMPEIKSDSVKPLETPVYNWSRNENEEQAGDENDAI